MKIAVRIGFFLVVQWMGYGAFAGDKSVIDLRELIVDLKLEHSDNVMQLMQWNDSLLVNKRTWQSRYDSLLADTLSITMAERNLVNMDAALLNYTVNPSLASYMMLKSRFSTWEIPYADTAGYVRELLSILLEYSVEQNDYQWAYAINNRLHAQYYNDWKISDEVRLAQYDSLQRNKEEMSKQGARELGRLNELLMQWHILAVVAFILLLVALIVLIVMGNRWRKQRLKLSEKASDTSEEEALVHKLEEARREIIELKLMAKKKAEVAPAPAAPVSVEVPPVPSKALITEAEIADWNDQVQQALIKIKGHCEAGKTGMSVPTYMSIVNDTTRLSAQVSKKTEQWIALLQSK